MLKRILKLFLSCWGSGNGEAATPSGFVFPKMNKCFFIRLGVIVLVTYLFFGFICIPTFVKGGSMEPTYKRIGFNFCWRPTYWFSPVKRGDIVIIKYTDKTLFLKRVVGLPGDTVEFNNGRLFVNGEYIEEPYRKYVSDWTLPAKKIEPGHIYVVGDNRSMPQEGHKFGMVSLKRLYGAPLW